MTVERHHRSIREHHALGHTENALWARHESHDGIVEGRAAVLRDEQSDCILPLAATAEARTTRVRNPWDVDRRVHIDAAVVLPAGEIRDQILPVPPIR